MDNSTSTLKDHQSKKKNLLTWLCNSGQMGEMESLIIAAQDQALNTCYHQRNIMKHPVNSNCSYGIKWYTQTEQLQEIQQQQHNNNNSYFCCIEILIFTALTPDIGIIG
jgi:hypothetical protein